MLEELLQTDKVMQINMPELQKEMSKIQDRTQTNKYKTLKLEITKENITNKNIDFVKQGQQLHAEKDKLRLIW